MGVNVGATDGPPRDRACYGARGSAGEPGSFKAYYFCIKYGALRHIIESSRSLIPFTQAK